MLSLSEHLFSSPVFVHVHIFLCNHHLVGLEPTSQHSSPYSKAFCNSNHCESRTTGLFFFFFFEKRSYFFLKPTFPISISSYNPRHGSKIPVTIKLPCWHENWSQKCARLWSWFQRQIFQTREKTDCGLHNSLQGNCLGWR